MRKIDVSAKMELAPVAITQYMKGKRGATFAEDISRSKKTMKIVADIAEALAKGDVPIKKLLEKQCAAYKAIRTRGIICQSHRETIPSLQECEACKNAD